MPAMVFEARPEEDVIVLGLVEVSDIGKVEGLIDALGFVDEVDTGKNGGLVADALGQPDLSILT